MLVGVIVFSWSVKRVGGTVAFLVPTVADTNAARYLHQS
jgi:hypothetical protein